MSKERRKLRVLVITMGAERQEHIKDMFNHPTMKEKFEPPEFSPGVSSRTLRKRYDFFEIANEAGLLPEQEWQAIRDGQAEYSEKKITESLRQCTFLVHQLLRTSHHHQNTKNHYKILLIKK